MTGKKGWLDVYKESDIEYKCYKFVCNIKKTQQYVCTRKRWKY